MTLFNTGLSTYNFSYDNWGANPATTYGTSVIPGASNAEGSWTQIASSANISEDVYWLYFQVHSGATAAGIKMHLLDIGVDPAGGASYTAVVSNFIVGCSPAVTGAGNREYCIPFFIKSGSSVAVRIQGSNATAGTVRVAARFWGKPSRPEVVPVGAYTETIGTITSSAGVTVTPGNAADGAYVSLGTTVKPLWWWQLGHQINNGTITAEYTYLELAWGDVTNKKTFFKVMHVGTTGETCGLALQTSLLECAAYCEVPAGSTIYARARCSDAPDTGYNVVALGVGG
jgi:hypothetical protein